MPPFTLHELEIIEAALVRYLEKLDDSEFGRKETSRIETILGKISELLDSEA